MNAEDYTQGSKPNPFSWNDFNFLVETERWQCGWIYNVNGQKVYVGGDHLGCPFNGSRINPYPEATFYEMRNHGIWTGGYIDYGEESARYVTSGENPYYGTGELLGSEDNPWPLSLFEELCVNEIWEGGWVTYPNGANYFIDVDMEEPDIEGCGSSGCGCGEDVGCGCGEDEGGSGSYGGGSSVAAGNYTTSTGDPAVYDVTISWTSGTTTGDITSSITAEAVFSSFSSPSDYYRNATPSLTLDANWIGNNGISAVGVYSYEKYNNEEWEIRYGHINVACTAH